jgi:hypothetical protein
VFLDHFLNSTERPAPDTNWSETMQVLENISEVTDEDEQFLKRMENRFNNLKDSSAVAAAANAELGRVEVSDSDNDDEDDEQEQQHLGRGQRRPSSRFYAMLQAERRRLGAEGHDDAESY